MKFLLSNDDGCQAPGLRCLRDQLRTRHEVAVVAPDRNRSGASNSLTIMNPLRVQRHDDGSLCVDGTPTDCVHLALTGLADLKPDIVVRSEEHTSELQSLMRISYAVFCLKKTKLKHHIHYKQQTH